MTRDHPEAGRPQHAPDGDPYPWGDLYRTRCTCGDKTPPMLTEHAARRAIEKHARTMNGGR